MDANVLVMVCYPEYAKLNVSEESEVSTQIWVSAGEKFYPCLYVWGVDVCVDVQGRHAAKPTKCQEKIWISIHSYDHFHLNGLEWI